MLIIVFEVLDPLDLLFAPGENTRANPNKEKYDVFVGLEVMDPVAKIVSSKRSQPQSYITGSSIDFKKETYEFNDIYASFTIRIYIMAFKTSNKRNDGICTGLIEIPLSRLEPNATVSYLHRTIS